MVQILPQRDFGGELGKALGGSLSEGFSKSFQSSRLANAFEKFQKTGKISDLMRAPGAAEVLPLFAPYIQRSMERSGLNAEEPSGIGTQKEPQQEMSVEGGLPGPANLDKFGGNKENIPEMQKTRENVFEKSSELAEKGKKILKSPTSTDIDQEVNNLAKMKKYSFLSIPELRTLAESNLKTNYESQQKAIKDVQALAETGISRVLQQSGLEDYSKIEGNITNRINEQLKADVANGATPEQAWNNVEKALFDIGRGLTKLKSGSPWAKRAESDMKSLYTAMEKIGVGDRFPVYVSEIYGIPEITASQIVAPVTNEAFKKAIPKLFASDNDYIKMAKSIKPSDNIASMMDYLDDKGKSIIDFKDAIMKSGKFDELTEEQRSEFLNNALSDEQQMNKLMFKTIER
jgi:predicted HicB family RNase H-like nuclease